MIEYQGSKVKLKTDLTRYHPNLKIGAVGTTCGTGTNDCFVKVCFPDASGPGEEGCRGYGLNGVWDILWDGLEEC